MAYCNKQANYFAPKYPDSCAFTKPVYHCKPKLLFENFYCGTPVNFISPENEIGELHTAFQDRIVCAACITSVDNEMTITGASAVSFAESAGVEGSLSFGYAGGTVALAGLINESITPETPIGTRRLFLNVPVILSYEPLDNVDGERKFLQFWAGFSALLMPGQCPEITTLTPNIEAVVKVLSPSALRISEYSIDADAQIVTLYLETSEATIAVYFIDKVDGDIYTMGSSMPKVTC